MSDDPTQGGGVGGVPEPTPQDLSLIHICVIMGVGLR